MGIQSELLHIRKNGFFRGFGHSAIDQKNARTDEQVLEQGPAASVEGTDLVSAWIELSHEGKPIWIIDRKGKVVNNLEQGSKFADAFQAIFWPLIEALMCLAALGSRGC